jgi:hypothetical protein
VTVRCGAGGGCARGAGRPAGWRSTAAGSSAGAALIWAPAAASSSASCRGCGATPAARSSRRCPGRAQGRATRATSRTSWWACPADATAERQTAALPAYGQAGKGAAGEDRRRRDRVLARLERGRHDVRALAVLPRRVRLGRAGGPAEKYAAGHANCATATPRVVDGHVARRDDPAAVAAAPAREGEQDVERCPGNEAGHPDADELTDRHGRGRGNGGRDRRGLRCRRDASHLRARRRRYRRLARCLGARSRVAVVCARRARRQGAPYRPSWRATASLA